MTHDWDIAWDLAPDDAVMTTNANPHRCWNCAYYSFKMYGDDDDATQGKCFRDRRETGGSVYWVDGLMTCPAFKDWEQTMTKVPSLNQRIILSCDRCGYHTPQMTQDDLDQFGTPWYCPTCSAKMTKFTIIRLADGLRDEKP